MVPSLSVVVFRWCSQYVNVRMSLLELLANRSAYSPGLRSPAPKPRHLNPTTTWLRSQLQLGVLGQVLVGSARKGWRPNRSYREVGFRPVALYADR